MLAAVGNSRASLNGDLGPSYGNPVPPLQDLYLYSYGNPVLPLQDLYLSLYLYLLTWGLVIETQLTIVCFVFIIIHLNPPTSNGQAVFFLTGLFEVFCIFLNSVGQLCPLSSRYIFIFYLCI